MTLDEKLKTRSLPDNGSTDNIFCNKKCLNDIHEVDVTLDLKSNGRGLSPNLWELFLDLDKCGKILMQLQILCPKI